jgi:pre-rRNA-processing protein TSR2
MTSSARILVEIARQHYESFKNGTISTQWEYFEYGVKLSMSRWTALRMAMEGEWGGGDMRRKYEILLEEILHVYKYNKNVFADDMTMNISEYVESEFGLICEDGSVEEISELLCLLAEECKKGQFERVRTLHEQVEALCPIDLKKAKQNNQSSQGEMVQMDEIEEKIIEEDGWATVRRCSSRKKTPPKFYDPAVEFPGAQ